MLRQVVRVVPARRAGVLLRASSPCVSSMKVPTPTMTSMVVRYASSSHSSYVAHKTGVNAPKRIPLYSRHEVAKHNHEDDCWIIIHGNVYNVTDWIPKHPGGEIIMAHAGGDSTSLFEQMSHSSTARELMKDYFIGQLDPKEASLRADLSGSEFVSPDKAVFDKY